jgi:hypothetical protein
MRIKKLKRGFEKLTKKKASIIAHLIGDGAHYQTKHDYVLKYEVRDDELLNQFEQDIIAVYGLKPSRHINTSGKTGKPISFVRLRSKLAYEDLSRYATYFSKDWSVKSPMTDASLEIKREFLRALFDDEGSVIGREIRLYSINEKGLAQVQKMLGEFGIPSKFRGGYGHARNVFALIIIEPSFKDKIGFSLKRKQEKCR